MTAAWAIAKRELRAFFHSPVAYVAIVGYLILRTLFFAGQIWQLESAQRSAQGPLPLESVILAMFGDDLFWSFMIVIPLLTMRLMAEERSGQTAPLLLTAPVRTGQVILGKFLGAFGVVALMLLAGLNLPLLVTAYGQLRVLPLVSGVLAGLLLAAFLVAVGLMASSLTESQFVAAILAVTLNLGLYLFGTAVTRIPYIGASLDQFSLLANMEQLGGGMIDTAPLVFFVTGTGFFLFLTTRVVESQRWR